MTTPTRRPETPPDASEGSNRGHTWMMIACCIPMLAIAGVLVATGVASPSFLIAAVACTAMMAFMMRGMHGGSNNHDAHR